MSTSASATDRRGIPSAAFVEDVQTYLIQLNLDVNSALAFLQDRTSAIQSGGDESSPTAEGSSDFPDIEKCLDVVAILQAKNDTGE
ncbi:hypothetical protein CASFOL_021722 [Castilleja foliolosa]|uniref:Uncharacterized protein n=1 Tax=Castilleja foliolosa TaxID=1961234 RepID=A0ABD3CY75_9LAMI